MIQKLRSTLLLAHKYDFIPEIEMSGCSENEIAQICQEQNITQLPEYVHLAYRKIGKNAGSAINELNFTYPNVLDNKMRMQKLLPEFMNELDNKHFVFFNGSDYQFWFVNCLQIKDPDIFYVDLLERKVYLDQGSFSDNLLTLVQTANMRYEKYGVF